MVIGKGQWARGEGAMGEAGAVMPVACRVPLTL